MRIPLWAGLGVWVLCAAAAAGALSGCSSKRDAKNRGEYRTAAAVTGDIAESVRLRGKVIATKKVPIFSETRGQVVKLYVNQGERVNKGDPLLQLDQTELANSVEKQKIAVEKSHIHLQNIETDFKRKEELFRDRYIPEMELEAAKKEYDIAVLDYSMAKKDLDTMTQQLGKTSVLAPISGIVTKKNVEEGEVVGSVADGASAKLLLEITDMSERRIELSVTEIERLYIREGQDVTFSLDADPSRRYKGRVIKIDAAATTEPGTNQSLFRAEAEILEPDENQALGISATVEMVKGEARGVVTVPVEAVFREGENAFVYLHSGERRQITPGLSDGFLIEIKAGLKAGEKVLLDEPGSLDP